MRRAMERTIIFYVSLTFLNQTAAETGKLETFVNS